MNWRRTLAITTLTLGILAALTGISTTATGTSTAMKFRCPPLLVKVISKKLTVVRFDKDKKWEVTGSEKFKLLCGIITGHFDLRIQRRDQFPHRRFEFVTQGQPVKQDLAGKHTGFTWTMHIAHICYGVTNWRLRLFESPGEAIDGGFIVPHVSFHPHVRGAEFNCNPPG